MLLHTIYSIVSAILWAYNIIIIIRCVLSFMPQSLYSPGGRVIVALTEPILAPCRKLLSSFNIGQNMPFDFSPLVAFLILTLLSRLLSAVFGVFLGGTSSYNYW